MADATQSNGIEAAVRARTLELKRSLEATRAEMLRFAGENARLARRVAELESASLSVRESRRAALNVMEDAVRSNRIAESLNADLKHEIAERARAEEALRASEDRLRTLADEVPQIIWSNQAEGRASYFNRRWFDYSGLTLAESAGLGWEAIVHPDDAPASQKKWQEALSAGSSFDCEYRLRRHDGGYRWFIGRNVPLRSRDGRITGWFGSATDIHDLKEAQAAMREREEQFRRAIQEAPIPVIMHAEDGEVLQISRSWTELTGYAAQEIPTFDAWLTRAYGEGGDAVRERMRAMFASRAAHEQSEFEILTRSGQRRHWLFSVSIPGMLPDGRRYAVGMALDLTERKRAEAALAASQERFRLVVESALEHAIISTDRENRVTSWNRGAEEILGYGRDEILGQKADVIFTPEDREAGAPRRETELALEQGRAADERWHLRKNGSRFWGTGVMLPMYERSGGNVSGFLKILQDETERREVQEALEASREKLMTALRETDSARASAEAAARAKDDFLAALSHELRTPLNPVLLLASEAAERVSLPDDVREDFAAIRNQVQLEARLIDDLLDLTRVSHGKLSVEARDTDGHEILRKTVAIVRQEIAQKDIEFVLALEATHALLYVDPVRIQQVFWNVLKNAVKFTPDGGRVELRTRNPAGTEHLLISVVDTGIGMTPTEIDGVFNAFVQGDHAEDGRSRRFGGLGLGLTISKMLVEIQGGAVRASSPGRNRGSTFDIELPLAKAPAGTASQPNGRDAPVAAPDFTRLLQHERLLLVEDHEPTRQALATLLRRRGLNVETATSASEALQIAERFAPTLLLSDIGLPDGDGYALMHELRERYGVRGIALTGYGANEDLSRSRAAGFDAHLTKPISLPVLAGTLLAVVGGNSAIADPAQT